MNGWSGGALRARLFGTALACLTLVDIAAGQEAKNPAGSAPTFQGELGAPQKAGLQLGLNLVNDSGPGVSTTYLSLTENPPNSNQWFISGTLNGIAIDPPIPVGWFTDADAQSTGLDGHTHFEYNTATFQLTDLKIAFWTGLLTAGVTADIAIAIVHELLHAIFARQYPEFSVKCAACAHVTVYAVAAASLCQAGQACPIPPGVTEKDREDMCKAATAEAEKCEKEKKNAGGAGICDDPAKCDVPANKRPPNATENCPGPCAYSPCSP